MRPQNGLRRAALIAATLVAGVVSACGGVTPSAGHNASSQHHTAPGPTLPGLVWVSPSAYPSEPTAETAREARKPDPAFDFGYVVQITPQGFHPAVLVATCCTPIVWLNLTNRPNSVVFTVESGGSGVIPPGGSWSFAPPNTESLAYHSGTYPSMTGAVQVNQSSE